MGAVGAIGAILGLDDSHIDTRSITKFLPQKNFPTPSPKAPSR